MFNAVLGDCMRLMYCVPVPHGLLGKHTAHASALQAEVRLKGGGNKMKPKKVKSTLS